MTNKYPSHYCHHCNDQAVQGVEHLCLPLAKKYLLNLLARIHRDGGHYTDLHGIEKSCAEADKVVAAAFALIDEKSQLLEIKNSRIAELTEELARKDEEIAGLIKADNGKMKARIRELEGERDAQCLRGNKLGADLSVNKVLLARAVEALETIIPIAEEDVGHHAPIGLGEEVCKSWQERWEKLIDASSILQALKNDESYLPLSHQKLRMAERGGRLQALKGGG